MEPPPTTAAIAPTTPMATSITHRIFCTNAAEARPRMFSAKSRNEQMVPMMMVIRKIGSPRTV